MQPRGSFECKGFAGWLASQSLSVNPAHLIRFKRRR